MTKAARAKTELQSKRRELLVFMAPPNYPMPSTRQPAKNPTDFESRVYEAVAKIPRGRVSTYGAIASEIGSGSSRAVGQALRKNPFAPEVPCHPVVQSDGSLGGFFGKISGEHLTQKQLLLQQEGVCFDSAGRVEERFLRRMP
jgi:methylated-DNA-[protein]-cysteine S-methyltransferase